jgi:ElaB/YqjD/DUF883 family membrane-anchored ribosome-binding protein
LAKFESFLSENQLQSFKSTQGKWKGVIEDENLYNVWVNINQKFEQQPGYTNCSTIGNANDSTIDAEQPHQELSIPILGEQTLENVDLNASFSYYGPNQSWMNIEGVGDVITLTVESSPKIKEIPDNLSNNLEAETDQLQKQKQDFLSNVETPHKNSFFWPEIKPNQASINKAKKRIPTVIVSSDEYISYNTKKQSDKEQEIKNKLERKLKREAKKVSSEKYTGKKTKNETTLSADNTSVNIGQFNVGNYVIIRYEEEYFPGMVLEISSTEASVKVMGMSGPNWKWPEKDDILSYPIQDIVQVIPEPELLNSRGIFRDT